jgi:hypothetical protein
VKQRPNTAFHLYVIKVQRKVAEGGDLLEITKAQVPLPCPSMLNMELLLHGLGGLLLLQPSNPPLAIRKKKGISRC